MMTEAIAVLDGKRIVLGVTGSIACYKAVDLVSKLTQAGAQVDVLLTEAAGRFVTPLTFQAVSGRAVYTDMWHDASSDLPVHIAHVGLAEGAGLLVIAPATADALARLAGGFASDLIGVVALAARCRMLIAPAMDGTMYAHPAVQANIETLRARGATIIPPEVGRFASGLTGQGRLPETVTLIGWIRRLLGESDGALRGRHIVVTAGGTREAIDPVRFITNRSSGRQGHALAQAAIDMGARVTLISAADLPAPIGATLQQVTSAAHMESAVLTAIDDADALIMAAAVADFRVDQSADHKIKRGESDLVLTLVPNPDILMAVKARRAQTGSPRVVVGFAAESDDLIANAQSKIARKGLDLIVANDITADDAGFEVETNRVHLIAPDGAIESLPLLAKPQVSMTLLARVAALLDGK